MKKRARRQYDDDDGRVIAPMNIEGMPWYDDRAPKIERSKEERFQEERKREAELGLDESEEERPAEPQYHSIEVDEPLTKAEERAILWGTLKAAFLIGSVFAVAGLLFVLFCVFVWL